MGGWSDGKIGGRVGSDEGRRGWMEGRMDGGRE